MENITKVMDCLNKVKAGDLKIYNLKAHSPFFDYVIIATIEASRQASACINYLKKETNLDIKKIEGKNGSWILIDAKDIIIHIFTKEEREYYDLDRLYLGLPQIQI